MFNTKILLAAASLAVVTAAGMAGAGAQPYDIRHDRQELRQDHRDIARDRQDIRQDRRELRHDEWRDHRFADRGRISDSLRFHRYRVVGTPYWAHGRYVVRTHDRFGRLVFVQVDPRSGGFIREVIL